MSKKVRIAICDDDKYMAQELYDVIIAYNADIYDYHIDIYNCVADILDAYTATGAYDVVFMDIEVGADNGVVAARELRMRDDDFILFFVTSHSSYHSDAYRLGATQYVNKPIDTAEFYIDLGLALEKMFNSVDKYYFFCNGKSFMYKYGEIYAVDVKGKRITIYTCDGKYEEDGRSTISEKEIQFEPYRFARCHKSYIVNLSAIRQRGNDGLILLNGEYIPIGRTYREQFIYKYMKYAFGGSRR